MDTDGSLEHIGELLASFGDAQWQSSHPMWMCYLGHTNDDSVLYVGAPVRISGQVVGTLCCYYKAPLPDGGEEPNAGLREIHRQAVARFEAGLEAHLRGV